MGRPIFLTLISLLFFTKTSSSAPTYDLDVLCYKLARQNISNSSCLDFFLRDSRVQHVNLQELAVIAVDIVAKSSAEVQGKITSSLRNVERPSAKVPLDICSKVYSDGARLLKQARDHAVGKNFRGASRNLLWYAKFPKVCRISIDVYNLGREKKGLIGRIRDESNELIDLASIAKASNNVAGDVKSL